LGAVNIFRNGIRSLYPETKRFTYTVATIIWELPNLIKVESTGMIIDEVELNCSDLHKIENLVDNEGWPLNSTGTALKKILQH
jgi:hypothetical protein